MTTEHYRNGNYAVVSEKVDRVAGIYPLVLAIGLLLVGLFLIILCVVVVITSPDFASATSPSITTSTTVIGISTESDLSYLVVSTGDEIQYNPDRYGSTIVIGKPCNLTYVVNPFGNKVLIKIVYWV